MSTFPCRPRTEYDKWDLVFFDNETDKPAAYAEIKLHCNYEGILHDMDRLAEMRKPGVMLILSCWQTREAKERLGLYGRKLGVSLSGMEIATFTISGDWTGEEWEFAVIGFLARPQALPG